MTNFYSFRGTITGITDFMTGQNDNREGCYKFFTVENEQGMLVNFVVSPSTYVVDHEMLVEGDVITAYYDGDAPAILIYPPQYPALVIIKENASRHVKVSYFNNYLLSSDGQLQLNLSPNTQIVLTNGQRFSNYPGNRDLVVVYRFTTRSIPAQTTPDRIIILCHTMV
ncbi:MAG: hypothetical protein ABS882_07705 [Lysinibacillus sp.]